MTKRNIEKYIKTLKGRIDSNRISVVLYDEGYDIYHYIYRIRRRKNECEMLSVNYEAVEYFDLTLPFIDQLDTEFGHCRILTGDPHVGQNARELCKILNQQVAKKLRD
jgi:hypothetical protein